MKKLIGIVSIFLFVALFSGTAFSEELVTGQKVPDFSLTDVNGQNHTLSQFQNKYVVLEWTNHGCPFVVKHYGSGNMQNLQKNYTDKGVIWLSINSSAPGKEGNHTAEEWQELLVEKKSAATATLLDADGKVGHLYGAKTTPHMYIINPSGNLIYQGAIDSVASTDAADISKSTNYVSSALDEAMAGKPVSQSSTKAYGCSVKY